MELKINFAFVASFAFLSMFVHCQSGSIIPGKKNTQNKTFEAHFQYFKVQCLAPEISEDSNNEPIICPQIFLVPTYRYDKDSKICVKFISGGCGSNENRFKNLGDCVKTCRTKNDLILRPQRKFR